MEKLVSHLSYFYISFNKIPFNIQSAKLLTGEKKNQKIFVIWKNSILYTHFTIPARRAAANKISKFQVGMTCIFFNF